MIKFRNKLFCKYNNVKKIRQKLAGYDYASSIGFFDKIRDELTITRFNKLKCNDNLYENNEQLEIVIRQFMLLNSMKYLTNSLLYYFGDVKRRNLTIALPNEWLEILYNNNIKIDYFRSKIKWRLKVFRNFIYNEVFLINLLCSSIINFFIYKNKNLFTLEYVYFIGLSKINFSENDEEKNGVTSFFNFFYFKNKYNKIYHDYAIKSYYENDVEISHTTLFSDYPRPSYLNLIYWSFTNFFIQIKSLIFFDWVNILLLTENSLAIRMKYQEKKLLAKKYLFHNSNWVYRPFWTYQAEKMGASIEFYFYSINNVSLSTNNILGIPYYGYKSMNWPFYILWDEFQLLYLNNITSRSNKHIIFRPIIFTKQKKINLSKKRKTIAVFDIQPTRDSLYKLTGGTSINYYTFNTCKDFIEDIYNEANSLNIDIIYKKKRDIGKFINYDYNKLITNLKRNINFISIDEFTSLEDIFNISDAIICQPFTSVSLQAKFHNKPIIFYESADILKNEDFSTHGLPFLKGRIQLREWLNNIC
jgi:polysaccharide biosynthesis PFTS motif protein